MLALPPPEYIKLRKTVLIVGPKDRAGLEGRRLQTPLVRDRGLYLGGTAGKGAINHFVLSIEFLGFAAT